MIGAPVQHPHLRLQVRAARLGAGDRTDIQPHFVGNWEFNPITEREGKVIGDRLLQIADPKLIKLVMKGDTIAGFLFGFPDISDGIRRANGRLWPLGWFWLLREFGRTKWINLNGAGILAPYRGLGVNAILYVEMQKTIASGNF